ncbi:hypothetical protein [Staphylothermus hellenicus]|uniref:CRISPR type III A-associated protein Csm2 n=1 Tax=Staphylothermus hellenicus (strain DSM 12710 / JCM 10830 / BK20S6-10-b1 / P8) TaxID=591019 RepID=D7DBU3_STAHD|nr:hypothetical protein [Staphylothermus hellenicus]ADI31640.1 hypothetical protein Shell_0509 [Staphylothermus hellenicus DSM 12710]
MSYRYQKDILVNTYLDIVKNKNYDLVLQNIAKYGRNYIKYTSKTAYRKIHSILTSILDKLLSNPEDRDKYIADLVESAILIRYQAERKQLNRDLSNSLVGILETFLKQIRNLDDESLRVHVRTIKMIIDSMLAFYYNKFE